MYKKYEIFTSLIIKTIFMAEQENNPSGTGSVSMNSTVVEFAPSAPVTPQSVLDSNSSSDNAKKIGTWMSGVGALSMLVFFILMGEPVKVEELPIWTGPISLAMGVSLIFFGVIGFCAHFSSSRTNTETHAPQSDAESPVRPGLAANNNPLRSVLVIGHRPVPAHSRGNNFRPNVVRPNVVSPNVESPTTTYSSCSNS